MFSYSLLLLLSALSTLSFATFTDDEVIQIYKNFDVEKDDTEVAASAAINTTRRFDMVVDEFIATIFIFVCLTVRSALRVFNLKKVKTLLEEWSKRFQNSSVHGKGT